jgi:hypothetical protein
MIWLTRLMNWNQHWQKAFGLGVLLIIHPVVLYAQHPGISFEDEIRVTDYLSKAEQALAADRLTTPERDNALAFIEQALTIAPHDARAITLLKRVVKRYGELLDTQGDTYHHAQRTATRELVREVMIAHVVLGERALGRGDLGKAQGHVGVAKKLASHYGIEEENLKHFSARLARLDIWPPGAFYKFTIIGTF